MDTTTSNEGIMNNNKDTDQTSIRQVKVKDIIWHPDYQIRAKLDQGAIKRYTMAYKQGAVFPPITLAMVNKGLLLVDGWHRLIAQERLGIAYVEAEIVQATEREALWLAAKGNLNHGVKLKAREYKKAFKAYIRAGQHKLPRGRLKSYREIAMDLGGHKSYGTIRNWMRQHFPRTFEQMGGNDMPPGGKGRPEKEKAPTMKEAALGYLDEVYAAIRGVETEEDRQDIVTRMERMIEQVQHGEIEEPEQIDTWETFYEELDDDADF